MRLVTVFFDFEGWWESQCRRRFNLEGVIRKVSKVLDNNQAKAVFNTCGIVAENFPKVLRGLHENGHEIASHGYSHENFIQLEQMGELDLVLGKTEKLIKEATGERPVGVRPPWLFSDKSVYSTIEKRGYRWVSNYNIFRTEVMDNPSISQNFKSVKRLFFSLLWKTYNKEPFKIGKMIEVPLLSSQDGELLSMVDPAQKSPDVWLDFAYRTLKTQFNKSKKVFNLNFHPWLIGTENRIILLDRILNYIRNGGCEFVLARDIANQYS